ncbi:TetR/AcrR family transcriptional regulator [Zavarzinia sp. CC-PAN008]|uniref:TetR/AcrR family transcriptional regulator n=1 Tax=Zavarzinia sp. CC-PAN008 TaxID=3243332 RepID=UPI003F743A94
MKRHEQIREAIIDAAKQRLTRYGYNKTTMAELAGDCNMSAGNLYRYFVSKVDIAEALARDSFAKTTDALRPIVRQQGLTAADRLEAFILKQLDVTYKSLEHDRHAVEIAELITRERPHVSNDNLAQKRSLIAEILALGNASGEFDVDDVSFVAEMIQAATTKFSYPQLFSTLPLADLEREARGVCRLLVTGLRRAPRPA